MGMYQLEPNRQTKEITISDAAVNVVMKNNALYYFSNNAITGITIDVDNEFKYGGFDFPTGSTAPTFSTPVGWSFNGADCSGGVFTPEANKYYRVAIERGFSTFVVTIQEVEFPA